MKRLRVIMPLLLSLALLAADRPPSPYIDRGACPFECCTYRRWRALKPMVLHDRPGGHRIVGRLQSGEWVRALTGETRSKPVALAAPFDVPKDGIRKGDRVFVLHYSGEGFWKVWVRGETVDEPFQLAEAQRPLTEWWAQVRTSSGIVGWVRAENAFANQDACG